MRPQQGKPVWWQTPENQRPKGQPQGTSQTRQRNQVMRAGGQLGDEDLPTSHRVPREREWTLKLCHGQGKPMPAHNNSKQLRNSLLLLSLFFPYLSHTLEEQRHLVSVWLEVSGKGSKADRSSNQKRKEADWPIFPRIGFWSAVVLAHSFDFS